jgi:hypothetical protein
MRQGTLERFAPLSGVLFLLLIIVGPFILTGETPDVDDSTRDVVDFWSDNDTQVIIGSILGTLAAVSLVWFGGVLRTTLRAAEGGTGRLSAVAFGGTLIAAVGILLFASLEFAAADSVNDVPPQVTQTLSVMDSEMFFIAVGGVIVMLLSTAVLTLTTGALPRWLGWAAIVILIVSFTPAGFIGFLAFLLWVAVVGIVIYRAQEAPPGTATPPPAAAPPGPS